MPKLIKIPHFYPLLGGLLDIFLIPGILGILHPGLFGIPGNVEIVDCASSYSSLRVHMGTMQCNMFPLDAGGQGGREGELGKSTLPFLI